MHSILDLKVLQSPRKDRYLCGWLQPLTSEGFHLYCVTQFHGKTIGLTCSSSKILNSNIFLDHFSPFLVIQNLTAKYLHFSLTEIFNSIVYFLKGLFSSSWSHFLLNMPIVSSSPKLLCLHLCHVCHIKIFYPGSNIIIYFFYHGLIPWRKLQNLGSQKFISWLLINKSAFQNTSTYIICPWCSLPYSTWLVTAPNCY